MIPNRPPGWAGFIALRRKPVTPPKRHGNCKHGHWTKAGIASARELRLVLRCLRTGTWLPMFDKPPRVGWRGVVWARAGPR